MNIDLACVDNAVCSGAGTGAGTGAAVAVTVNNVRIVPSQKNTFVFCTSLLFCRRSCDAFQAVVAGQIETNAVTLVRPLARIILVMTKVVAIEEILQSVGARAGTRAFCGCIAAIVPVGVLTVTYERIQW